MPEPKTTSKTTALTPSAAPKDRITVPISSSGATIARSSSTRMRKTIRSAIGTISRVSRRAASALSSAIAVWPPTSTPSPPASLRGRTDRPDEVERLVAVGVLGERRVEHDALLAAHARAHLGDALGAARRRGARRARGCVGDDDLGRRAAAARERLGEQLLALDRLDLLAEAVALRQALLEVEHAGAQTASSSAVADPHAARARRHALADPPPDAVRLVGALVAQVRDAVAPAEDRRAPERRGP